MQSRVFERVSASKRTALGEHHRFRFHSVTWEFRGTASQNSNSFNRTETLILNISFNYNYRSSSSPKLQRHLSRHFDSPVTVTNLLFSSLAYSKISKTHFIPSCSHVQRGNKRGYGWFFKSLNLAKEATHNTLLKLETILLVDYCTTSP